MWDILPETEIHLPWCSVRSGRGSLTLRHEILVLPAQVIPVTENAFKGAIGIQWHPNEIFCGSWEHTVRIWADWEKGLEL